jgi:adenylate kinase family enzyme
MTTGKLVPDNLVIDLVKEKLGSEDCVKKGWLLDGFPRTKAQVFLFLKYLLFCIIGRRNERSTNYSNQCNFSGCS